MQELDGGSTRFESRANSLCVTKGSGGRNSVVGREPHQGWCWWDVEREETLTADEMKRPAEARGWQSSLPC